MTGSFVIKKNRILEILFFIIIFLVNLKMTLNISNFATANLSILIIGISFISLLFTKIDDNIYWIVLFFILSLFRVEASKMLFVSLLVSISRNLYIDKIAKYSFCLTVLFLIINYKNQFKIGVDTSLIKTAAITFIMVRNICMIFKKNFLPY